MNTSITTPAELAEAAKRLIQDGECCGGVGSPYGKHTGCAVQFDEIAVGEAYLKLERKLAAVREKLTKAAAWHMPPSIVAECLNLIDQ